MHAYIHRYIHTYIHTYIYTYMHACIHTTYYVCGIIEVNLKEIHTHTHTHTKKTSERIVKVTHIKTFTSINQVTTGLMIVTSRMR